MNDKETKEEQNGALTALQVRYLLACDEIPSHAISLSRLASALNKSKSSARNAIDALCETGYIDKDYRVTDKGRRFLDYFKVHRDLYVRYLMSCGIGEKEAIETAKEVLPRQKKEIVEAQSRRWMRELSNEAAMKPEHRDRRRGRLADNVELSAFLPEGNYRISTAFLKIAERGETVNAHPYAERSMANDAFSLPRTLRIRAGEDTFLRFKVRDVTHNSKTDAAPITGKVRDVAYRIKGKDIQPQIDDNTLLIPLRHLEWDTADDGVMLSGSRKIYFSCTAGDRHMPRAAALLHVRIEGVAN